MDAFDATVLVNELAGRSAVLLLWRPRGPALGRPPKAGLLRAHQTTEEAA
jgi:hypothetical protein